MTQADLNNEVTELAPQSGVRAKLRRGIADLLTDPLGSYEEYAWRLRATVA